MSAEPTAADLAHELYESLAAMNVRLTALADWLDPPPRRPRHLSLVVDDERRGERSGMKGQPSRWRTDTPSHGRGLVRWR
jgi:hypothetical protein